MTRVKSATSLPTMSFLIVAGLTWYCTRKIYRVAHRFRHKEGTLAHDIEAATRSRLSPVEAANGFLQIANANMAAAIKRISVAKGYDLRDYVLTSFGGAGAQHACAIARLLGMSRVLCSP